MARRYSTLRRRIRLVLVELAAAATAFALVVIAISLLEGIRAAEISERLLQEAVDHYGPRVRDRCGQPPRSWHIIPIQAYLNHRAYGHCIESYTQDKEAQRDILTQILVVMIFPIGLVILIVLGWDWPEGSFFARVGDDQGKLSYLEPEGLKQVSSAVIERVRSQVEEVQRHIPVLRTPRLRLPKLQLDASSSEAEEEEERHIPILRTPRISQEEEDEEEQHIPLLRTPCEMRPEPPQAKIEAKIEDVGRHIPILRSPKEPEEEEEREWHLPIFNTPRFPHAGI